VHATTFTADVFSAAVGLCLHNHLSVVIRKSVWDL